MILTDYLRSDHDLTWDFALQCGVQHGTIRLPEDASFHVTEFSHMKAVYDKFQAYGIQPVVVEPLPNELHDHIKVGDEKRDESIEKFIIMMRHMDQLGIRTVCFNFMAHIGWLRTADDILERGGARVTGFDMKKFSPTTDQITKEALWDNYIYFIRAVIPYAEKYHIRLALHPDDPPVPALGGVARIMASYPDIKRAIHIVDSPMLGLTFCQANYLMMDEDIYSIVPELKDKIFFIHFRNVVGDRYCFRESFHDNGMIDMAKIMKIYFDNNIDVPIRVDHVPTMASEEGGIAGYNALGRLYAIGYLKGLMESLEKEKGHQKAGEAD